MEEYFDAWRNYADFEGDATLREFWMYKLVDLIILFGLLISSYIVPAWLGGILSIVLFVYKLATIIPDLSIIVRRLHDTGRSGAWFFVSFVPLIGGIWLLILLCDD